MKSLYTVKPPTGDDKRSHTALRARNDALRAMVAVLPDPVEYARYSLTATCADVLSRAWPDKNRCWRVSEADAVILSPYGLCAVGSPYLGNFGTSVLMVLREARD